MPGNSEPKRWMPVFVSTTALLCVVLAASTSWFWVFGMRYGLWLYLALEQLDAR